MNYKEAYAWGVELLEKACVEESKDRCMVFIRICDKDQQGSILCIPGKRID